MLYVEGGSLPIPDREEPDVSTLTAPPRPAPKPGGNQPNPHTWNGAWG